MHTGSVRVCILIDRNASVCINGDFNAVGVLSLALLRSDFDTNVNVHTQFLGGHAKLNPTQRNENAMEIKIRCRAPSVRPLCAFHGAWMRFVSPYIFSHYWIKDYSREHLHTGAQAHSMHATVNSLRV